MTGPIEFPPYPRDPNSIRGRAYAARLEAEHNGMLPSGVIKHSVSLCRPEWCGEDPLPAREAVANEACVGAEPDEPVRTQDELLTALDELLDSSLHDDRCYIDANDTTCVCIIGRLRAALPPCGAVYRPAHPQRGDRIVTCHRNAHPASPDRHVF